MLTPTEFKDFAGGLTDFVTNSSPDSFITGDNLLYTKQGELFSRPGSNLLDPTKAFAGRISSLWNFGEDSALFAQSARKLGRWTNPGWAELTGPTGNSFFQAGTDANRVTGSEWKGHMFLTNDNPSSLPMKVYQAPDASFKAVTAGLPRFLSVDAFTETPGTLSTVAFATLANQIRTQFIAHYANVLAHPTGADVTSGAGIPAALNGAGGDTFATCKAMVDALQVAYNLHYVDARLATGSRLYHSNSLGDYPGEPNLPLEDDQTVTIAVLWKTLAQRLNDLKKRFNWHVRSIYGHPQGSISITTQGVTVVSNTNNGNLSIQFTGGAVAGAEVVSFFGTAITVQVQSGVSTITQVVTALTAANVFSVGSLFPATASGAGAAVVNAAGVQTKTSLVENATFPDLAGTDEGPIFTDLEYSNISNFVNFLKQSYSGHAVDLGGPHSNSDGVTSLGDKPLAYAQPGGLSAGIINRSLWVTLFDSSPTDLNSVIELTCHLYAAYRRHQEDAALPGIVLTGTSIHATKNIITTLTPVSTALDATHFVKGAKAVLSVVNGMFVRAMAAAGNNTTTPINEFPAGTTVAGGGGTTALTTSANHNDATGADEIQDFVFTKRVLHGVNVGVVSTGQANDPSIKTGNVQTLVDLMAASTSLVSLAAVLLDVATCFNYHDSNNENYHHPGVPGGQYAVDLTSLLPIHQYIYAWIYSHEYYTLTGEKFRVVSAPYFKTKLTSSTPDTLTTQITTMPTISQSVNNGVDTLPVTNYDKANIKIEVYRTPDNLQTPFLVGSVALGVTTFADNVADTELKQRAKLYTTGGVIDSDPPPTCKILHITKEGVGYYGNTSRVNNDLSLDTVPQRINQADPDAPDDVNAGNFKDLPLPLVGLSSVSTLPLAWTAESTHRIEGLFDDQGRGSIKAEPISTRIGLAAGFSPLQVDGGVVFAGPDQFYLTNGYTIEPLGRAWPKTYATIIATPGNILGAFDKLSNRAFFTASKAGGESDTIFVLDFNQTRSAQANFSQVAGTKTAWTTWSNGASFVPTAIAFFQGQLVRGDASGNVFIHPATATSDPKVVAGTVTAGISKAVVYNLTTVAFNFGVDTMRKMGIFLQAKFKNLGNLSLQFISNNDQGRTISGVGTVKAIPPIRSRVANQAIDEQRFFPSGNIRFASKQLTLTNAKVIITNSDALGVATVTGGNTVTIPGVWPTDLVDHVLAFVADGYTAEFPVTANTSAHVLTCAGGGIPNVVGKWILRGIPKDEQMQLQEIGIWTTISGANQTSAGGESGANA